MELSPATTASLWVLGIAHVIVAVVGQIWFLYRRHRQPIAARFPVSAAVTLIVLTIHLETSIIGYLSPLPCLPAYCIENTLGTIGTIGYTLRSAVFFWQCRIIRAKLLSSSAKLSRTYQQQVRLAGQKQAQPSQPRQSTSKVQDAVATPALSTSDTWYLEHQWITSNRFIVTFWIVVALLLIAFLVASVATGTWLSDCTQVNPALNAGRQVWYVVWVAALGYYSFRLRVCVDGFFIKRELLSSFAFGMIYFVFWFTPDVAAYDATTYPVLMLLYWVLIQADYVVSVWIPLVLSYTRFSEQTADASMRLDDFLTSDPAAIAAFAEYLCQEFAVENLQFLLAVNAFKKKFGRDKKANVWTTSGENVALSMSSHDGETEAARSGGDDAMRDHANDICDAHVKPDAPLAVNLSGRCRDGLLAAMESARALPVTVFDEAAAEIKRILEPSSYVRFLRSDVGRQLLRAG
ncbi:RGS domain-containing protein [Plasmodiophora brassicae]